MKDPLLILLALFLGPALLTLGAGLWDAVEREFVIIPRLEKKRRAKFRQALRYTRRFNIRPDQIRYAR